MKISIHTVRNLLLSGVFVLFLLVFVSFRGGWLRQVFILLVLASAANDKSTNNFAGND